MERHEGRTPLRKRIISKVEYFFFERYNQEKEKMERVTPMFQKTTFETECEDKAPLENVKKLT